MIFQKNSPLRFTTVNSEYQPELVGAHIQTIPYIIEPNKILHIEI